MIYRRFGAKPKLRFSAEASSSAEYSVFFTTEGSASAEGQNFHFGLTLTKALVGLALLTIQKFGSGITGTQYLVEIM